LFELACLTLVNIGWKEGARFYLVRISFGGKGADDGANKNAQSMLATKDNTEKGQRPAERPTPETIEWVTRQELAALSRISVNTVDRMVANDELPCVRLRGRVRFYLPDVVEALRKGGRKYGRAAVLPGGPMGDENCREDAQEAQKV
jgi:excisionase family DNA binding protein